MGSNIAKELSEWSLQGRTLSFPKEVLNYAKYYSEYVEFKKGVDTQFCEIYESYGTMEKMINGIEEDCCKIIYCSASVYIDRVIDAGFYDLNEEIFFRNYVSKIKSKMELEEVCDWVVLLKNLKKAIQRNGISEVTGEEFCSNVQKQIEDLKREARTFQGIVYETEQEAREAKRIYELEQEKCSNERKELEKWKAETDFSDKDSLIQLKSKIIERQFVIEEADLCLKKIDEELEKIDRQERTVDGIEYNNHEAAMLALKDKEEYEKVRDGLFYELQPLIFEKKYQEAMQYLIRAKVSEEWKRKMKTDLSHVVAQQLEAEIKQSCEYKKSKESGGIGTIIVGCIGILVIGFLISLYFPVAFIIAVVLAVFGIIGNIMEAAENRKREPSYHFIQKLIQCGYEIEIK